MQFRRERAGKVGLRLSTLAFGTDRGVVIEIGFGSIGMPMLSPRRRAAVRVDAAWQGGRFGAPISKFLVCRVRGLAGLRVIDASVFPMLLSSNTNIPTIMLAEKIADQIRYG